MTKISRHLRDNRWFDLSLVEDNTLGAEHPPSSSVMDFVIPDILRVER